MLAEASPVLVLLDEMAKGDWPSDMPRNISERHDRYLAELHADPHEPTSG